MGTTLTVRTDESLRRALAARAKALGVGMSELVRMILQEALDERPLGARTGGLRGRLDLGNDARGADAMRERLRKRNWRA